MGFTAPLIVFGEASAQPCGGGVACDMLDLSDEAQTMHCRWNDLCHCQGRVGGWGTRA